VIPVTIGKINLINRGIIPVGYHSSNPYWARRLREQLVRLFHL